MSHVFVRHPYVASKSSRPSRLHIGTEHFDITYLFNLVSRHTTNGQTQNFCADNLGT